MTQYTGYSSRNRQFGSRRRRHSLSHCCLYRVEWEKNRAGTVTVCYLSLIYVSSRIVRINEENQRRYSMPSFISQRHDAANVFLAHYHYRTQPCNPFKIDWRRRHTTPFADMTPTEVQFICRTKEMVEQYRELTASSLFTQV
jgi:hypothetical protein